MIHRDLENLPTGKIRCKTQLMAHTVVRLPVRYVVPLKVELRKSKAMVVKLQNNANSKFMTPARPKAA